MGLKEGGGDWGEENVEKSGARRGREVEGRYKEKRREEGILTPLFTGVRMLQT